MEEQAWKARNFARLQEELANVSSVYECIVPLQNIRWYSICCAGDSSKQREDTTMV